MTTVHPPTATLHGPRRVFADGLRNWRRLLGYPGAVASALASALETRVGTTPCDVVYESGGHRLLRYRREVPATWAEPVLFCYALINRPYILDLQPDKSVVRQYLDRGFEVYIVDWGVPSYGDRFFTLEHYVSGFLEKVVRIILREHGREDLHLLGYCMGGTLSVLLAALHPAPVKSLTLLAAPIDFGEKESLLNVWADPAYFDVDAFIDAQGNCPAWFLQACFQNTKPIQNLVQKYLSMFGHLGDRAFMSNYFAMELWVNDNIPMAGETFRAFVKDFYQNNRLVRGELQLAGQRIDLRRIECPLLLLMAKNDHLVAPPSTEGIRPHVRSQDVESIVIEAGHVGLVVGGKAQRSLWPEATRWLAARSTSSQHAS
jgi:poly[(R)-3-hydroxyalkanoate] polymerase subunit PhaC